MSAVSAPEPASVGQAAPTPAEIIMQLSTGYMVSISIQVAAKLGIADLLAKGPKPVSELASATGAHEDRLYRVLRVLACAGVFSETVPRTFAQTPLSETLRMDAPDSFRPMALWITSPFHFRTYAEIMHSVMTGDITFDHIHGKPVFEYLPEDPETSGIFNDAMTFLSQMVTPALLEAYDFAGIHTLMDVAGGHGALLRAILNEHPGMHGVLIDLEHVIEGAKQLPANQELANRCEFLSGDFFAEVPTSADAIIMKHIIHDWDDDKATLILKNCRKALAAKSNAKILLVESVIPPGNQPHLGKFIDLEMFVFPGGRERTEEEFRKLLATAGWRLSRVVPMKAPLWLVEAVPA
jgi:O-methyltransferase domain